MQEQHAPWGNPNRLMHAPAPGLHVRPGKRHHRPGGVWHARAVAAKYLVDERALAQQILRVGERAGRLAARKRGANPGQSHQGLPFFAGAHRLFQEATTLQHPIFGKLVVAESPVRVSEARLINVG